MTRRLLSPCRCLSILEHASFACPENESYLSTLTMSYGVHPFTTELYFAQWLLNQTNTLCFQILSNQGLKKECLRGFLGVLMNITQDNLEGCKVVVVSNGAQSLCSSLRLLVYGDPDGKRVSVILTLSSGHFTRFIKFKLQGAISKWIV